MKYIVLPVDAPAASQSPKGREGVVRRLSFYLAREEYVARHTDEPESGGGCVYADEGNIMLSYITKEENSQQAFYTFVNMILLVLHKMGITATSTSHNDILVEGKKVSGTACYQVHGHNIVHGTLLYDTNMNHMLNAITPSAEKLQAKGIESVRQRITLLTDHFPLSIIMLKSIIKTTLCKGELQLTKDDVAAIEEIEQGYLRSEFIQKM